MTAEAENAGDDRQEDIVTPWAVSTSNSAGINYQKLIEKFGCQPLGPDLVKRIEDLTGKRAHAMLRRGFFFAQRFEFVLARFFAFPSLGTFH